MRAAKMIPFIAASDSACLMIDSRHIPDTFLAGARGSGPGNSVCVGVQAPREIAHRISSAFSAESRKQSSRNLQRKDLGGPFCATLRSGFQLTYVDWNAD